MAALQIETSTPESTEDGRTGSYGPRANLRVLRALLQTDDDGDSLPELIDALHEVFAEDQAIVLEEDGDGLLCTASTVDHLIGRRWPADAMMLGVIRGQVIELRGDGAEAQRNAVLADLAPPAHPALFFPIGIAGRRAALVLQRGQGNDFSEIDLAFARQCAILTLAALAARNGGRLAAEVERLRRLVNERPQGGDETQRDLDFVRQVLDALPVGVTVQDDNGRFLLVNAVAAANLQTPAEVLVGASPADFLPENEAAERRAWEAALIQSGQPTCAEDTVANASGERAWLATHKPTEIFGQTLLLSTSVDITDRKQLENNLTYRAFLDELTGLPNRMMIEQCVERAIGRGDGAFALAFLDLDNFKYINDYFSHAIGDALLVKVGERIQKHLRDGDMLARMSGDEFLLLIDPLDDEAQLRSMIDDLLQELKQPFHIEAFEVFTSASLGVSIFPEHGTSFDELRRNADHAMYRAKGHLKGGAVYFDVGMGEKIAAKMELEQRLRLAIRDGKFCCAFQPKVDIHSQEVIGFETLVRWRDEAGEIQPPSSFIGLAIELGLIDPITHFVLGEAMNCIERLDEAFGTGTTISVNIAAKQASDLNFMRSLAQALTRSRYAERVMLELTEEAFVAKSQFQVHVLPMLREIGVRVSIDDFGTGYSSLSVLADITADEVKVDRSFITDIHQRPRSQSVLRTIESLCLALGMSVVAEGVETFEELAYLQTATRIRYAQGYYFSKPFFLDDLKDTRRLAADLRPIDSTREPIARRGSGSGRQSGALRAG